MFFLYRNHNLGTNLEPKDSTLTLVLLRCTVWSICFYSRVLCTLYMGRAPRPPAALEEIVYGKKKKERKHLLHSVKLSRMMNVIKRNKTKGTEVRASVIPVAEFYLLKKKTKKGTRYPYACTLCNLSYLFTTRDSL